MDVVASGAGARPSQPETSGSLLGAPRPAAAAREANPTPPSVEGLPPLEPGSDNDAAPAPSTNSASAPLTSGATGTSAPAGTSATSTDVGTAAPAATAAATTNNTTSPTPNETGPKLLHIVARFANGKRFSGALVGTGPSCRLRWRSSGGESYDWKKSISAGAAASSSGGVGTPSLLGRWFDVVSAPVIIGRNRMEKPGCANSMWFPATVLLLTGAEHTRIIVRFAGAAGPARGVVDADSKRILWVGDPAGSTADFCWTRSTAPADGNIFGDWLDEKNNPVSLSPSAASGVGQKYPARVEEIKNAASGAPVPVPRSKNRKKKYLPTRRRSRGGLPSGIDIVATFANGVRLDGKILDQGEKISWRGDRLGPYMWTRTLATAQQQGDVTQVSNKEGIDWKTDAKGVWYDAAKLPVRITANQITGPANPWYPAKLTSLSPLYGGPEPPPATKLKEQKRPSKKAARPQALALLRSGSSGLASPASGAGAPDIVLRFKNGLEMQGWLDRSGAKLTLYPQRYVWRRADDARSGVIGRWHDASMCVVVVGPDAVQGPNKAWYPAKVIATSDAATPASTSTVRSGAPTLTVPTRYQGLSIPRDILQMDAVKARREAAAIRAQIRALDRRYEECRQELGQAGVSVPPAVKKVHTRARAASCCSYNPIVFWSWIFPFFFIFVCSRVCVWVWPHIYSRAGGARLAKSDPYAPHSHASH